MKKIIDNSSLKLLAMLAMLIDHIAWVSFPLATNMNILSPNWLANSMHIIGRLAFPVFAFCIAEGYRHSHDVSKYMRRLGLLALISIIPFSLMGWVTGLGFIMQNTVVTLFLGLCALYYSDQFFTHYIYRRAARKEKSKHIVSHILLFRLCRSTRKFLSWEPHFSHYLLAKEKHIYDTYLCKYDYCDLLSSDYR